MKISKNAIFGVVLVAVAGTSYMAGAIGGQPKGGMTPASKIVFEPMGPGSPLQVAALWGDRTQGAFGMLLKLPPKFEAGSHMHTADYHGINVKGTWIHTMNGETKKLPVGSHVMQPGGAFHNDKCQGPSECILFIYQDAKNDFIPAETKKP